MNTDSDDEISSRHNQQDERAGASMYVKTHAREDGTTGLLVGAANARRFFAEGTAAIELELGSLQIQCDLGPKFWQDEPVIHDPRLNAWLEARNLHGRPWREPVPMALVPNGECRYRLQPVKRKRAAGQAAELPHNGRTCSQELIDSKYEAVYRAGRQDRSAFCGRE